jgi:hypothetical protein
MNDAIENNNLKVNVLDGPAGNGGFRSGWWQVQFGKQWFNIYCSLSHSIELADQESIIRVAAEKQIPSILSGNPIYRGGNGVAVVAPTKAQLFPNSMAAERELSANE